MENQTAAAGRSEVPPEPKDFWANELEFDSTRAEQALAADGAMEQWIDGLSGQQVRMLCVLLGQGHEGSVPKLRLLLDERAGKLHPFFLVQQFGKGKSEVAVVEVAREALSPRLVDLCIRRKRKRREAVDADEPAEERYDKHALLFALYEKDRDLLKEVFHFDKVHKKGFASMVLAEAVKSPPKTSFEAFLTEETVRGIVEAYQRTRRDGSMSELQGIWIREGRHYVFIRRTERPDHIHDGRRIVHGYRPEWIVLDFSPECDQVNIASNSVEEPREMTNRIASAYFGCECRFVNEEKMTDAGTIERFIAAARAMGNGVGLVEVCVSNSPLRGSSKVRISNEQAKALAESLDHFDTAVGTMMEDLADVEWIKVLYRHKRVGLPDRPGGACPHPGRARRL